MFYHVKELEFNARISAPDPKFAKLLLEQFGGGNGELKAALQYFIQSFAARKPYPQHYDMLMDIATEEFSHLEIVGATITMLLDGINGELKNATEQTELNKMMKGQLLKDELLHEMSTSPSFLVLTGGGPNLTNCEGVPFSGTFINATGDLTVDLRSNIAAESRAKIVYEYLLQFTDDPLVKETLVFLMTREVSHFQMFTAALEVLQPNFPPGSLMGDPRYTHLYTNFSQDGKTPVRGPWNEGQGPWPKGEKWVDIADPITHARQTNGLVDQKVEGDSLTVDEAQKMSKQRSKMRSDEVKAGMKANNPMQWSEYSI
jgi:Mn-containing catalase